MTRKTWSTEDVSAYLDGELTPEVQVAFEAAVKQDPHLQHRVTEIRQVVTLMRSVPLHEPPRNYLLTQAMVSKPKPQTRRPRLPLLWMRIATSVAAAAFVIASGLTLMQQGSTPGMVTQSRVVPEAEVMLESEAANDTVEMLEAPMAQAVPAEELAGHDVPAAPEAEKAVMFAEAMDEDLGTEAAADLALDAPVIETDEEFGMGGGEEAPASEAAEDWAAAPADATAAETDIVAGINAAEIPDAPPEEVLKVEAGTAPADIAAAEAMAEDDTPAGERTFGDGSTAATGYVAQEEQIPGVIGETTETAEMPRQDTRTVTVPWASIGLGILTTMLAGITFWVSRRQLH